MATRSRVDAVVAVVVSERIIQGVGMLRGGKSGGGIIDSGACVCVCVCVLYADYTPRAPDDLDLARLSWR